MSFLGLFGLAKLCFLQKRSAAYYSAAGVVKIKWMYTYV